MKLNFFNFILIIILLASGCSKNSETLFDKIQKETGVSAEITKGNNSDPNQDLLSFEVNTDSDGYKKASIAKNTIDKYLEVLPEESKTTFSDNISIQYVWKKPELEVMMKERTYVNDKIKVSVWYTKK